MNSRIPPLLEPYLSLPPEASLILLTSVLGASTNWLVLRYLYGALAAGSTASLSADKGANTGPSNNGLGGLGAGSERREEGKKSEGGDGTGTAVVLVSFLRDLRFWREGARKLGLDLPKLAARKRFVFVNGLSGLFLPAGAIAERAEEEVVTLQSPKLEKVYEGILSAVRFLQKIRDGAHGDGGEKILLIVDALDLLLATAGPEASTVGLVDMVMDLREYVHATILTLSNDSSLVLRQHTPLEISHAAFLLSLAHQAYLTMSLRLLDTGTARDVSGVIRIGGGAAEMANVEQVEAKELLYFVGGDGNVKVFERGQ